MTTPNQMHDHISLMEAEIDALKESVSLTRTMLANMATCEKDRDKAEQLVAANQEKILRLKGAIERYRDACG